MKSLTIIFVFIFLTTVAIAQEPEFPLDHFNDWVQTTTSHNSALWAVSSLEQAVNMFENDVRPEGAVRLRETHYVNSDGGRVAYLICRSNEEGCENLLMAYFINEENGGESLTGMYTKNSERNVWELVPSDVYPHGTYRQFAEYMHEKLGRYIIFHS